MSEHGAEYALEVSQAIIVAYGALRIKLKHAIGGSVVAYYLLDSIAKHSTYSVKEHVKDLGFDDNKNISYSLVKVLVGGGLIERWRPSAPDEGKMAGDERNAYYRLTRKGTASIGALRDEAAHAVSELLRGAEIKKLRSALMVKKGIAA